MWHRRSLSARTAVLERLTLLTLLLTVLAGLFSMHVIEGLAAPTTAADGTASHQMNPATTLNHCGELPLDHGAAELGHDSCVPSLSTDLPATPPPSEQLAPASVIAADNAHTAKSRSRTADPPSLTQLSIARI